jgi:hypothetical protein
MTLPPTFTDKIATDIDCILWVGATNSRGYGCFAIDGVSHLAHRLAYEDAHGAIPEGMTIDHLCRVKQCVNTAHMEVVTVAENTRRRFRVAGGLRVGSTCRHGHVINAESDLYVRTRGTTDCRECRREAKARAS